MKLVIFGLTISSSWGNGHATLWRGLCRGLAELNHSVVFFERNQPYYAAARDFTHSDDFKLVIYEDWAETSALARKELADCDAAIVTSYCFDACEAASLVCDSRAVSVFYDLDTPVTLATLSDRRPNYIPERGLSDFDLVLSYSGGASLDLLRDRLDARRVAPLYGHADPEVYARVAPVEDYKADLSYLGTYAADRQSSLECLFVDVARRRPQMRFCIGGAQYPPDFPWADNIHFVRHTPPSLHAAFYSSARLQLSVTRRHMATSGYSPSGRLFEAAACGAPVITDWWEGLDLFFRPGVEVLVARSTEDVLDALDCSDAELSAIARAGQARVLSTHTSAHRARALVAALESASASRPAKLEDA